MKWIIALGLVICCFSDVKAQFPSTDSLRNYNIVWITNNAAKAFTNYRLHTLLAGMIDWIDTARTGGGGSIGIDSLAALNDSTLRYRINGTFRTFNLKGVYDGRRKVDTLYKTSDTTIAFRINGSLYSITLPGRTAFVDTIYRKVGQDSIFYRKEGVEYALKDSTGGIQNANIGSAFRWLLPGTQEIKTVANSNTIAWDSTSNANSLTGKVDTSVIATQYDLTQVGSGISGLTTGRVVLSTSATTVGDDAELTYNSTTNALLTDSVREIRNQSDTFYTYLLPYTADTSYFVGDSYTTGSNATVTSKKYTTLVAAWLGTVERNMGVSGSTLMKRTPVDPYGAVNLIDRLNTLPTYTGVLQKYFFIAYGFNDMGVNNANYTPANFRIDYQQVIDTLLARGWPRHRIVIISPWYASTSTYSAYAGTTGTPATDRARHLAFIDTANAVATANGLRWVNAFTAQLNNDSTHLFSVDNIHPGNDGHRIIAETIFTTLTDTVYKNNQTVAANGLAEFQNIKITNPDTAAYDAPVMGYGPAGTLQIFNSHRIVKANPLWLSQPGNINMVGKGLFGAVTASDANEEENLMSTGGIKGRFLRANGTIPTLAWDSAVEIGLINTTTGYIGAYNRRSGTALNLSINGLGANIAIGTVSFAGSNRLQVSGNASATKFYGGGTTTPTATFHAIASTGGASTAPFKMTSGTLMPTPEVGAIEFLTDKAYFTITTGTARKEFALNDIALTSGRVVLTTTNGRLTELAPGTDGHVLTLSSGVPVWAAGGSGITSINSQTGPAISVVGSNGLTIATTTNTVTATLGGTLNGATNILGASNTLVLGTSGSKVNSLGVNAADDINLNADDRISILGGLATKVTIATDADLTMTTNMMSVVLPEITANRTLTLPSIQQGMLFIIHNQNSGAFTWNISGTLHNATNSTVSSLVNDRVYMLQGVDDGSLTYWKIISIYQ